jgi:hypothetical protein
MHSPNTAVFARNAATTGRIAGLLLLALMLPRISAQATSSAPAEATAAQTEEQKAALKALDADIARLDVVLESIHDAQLKALSKGFIDVFKEKRDRLRTTFDQTKYDELKFETVAEFQRLHLWLAAPRTSRAELGPTHAQQILFDLEPSPTDPAEVKAALQALDDEIKRREDQANRVAPGPDRDAAMLRLKPIKESRTVLGTKFTEAGWNAVISKMKSGLKKHRE